MSAQIIPLFSRLAALPRSADERFHTVSRARSICIGKQLSGAHKAVVLQCVDQWLDLNITADEVLRRARAKAEHLLNPPTGPEAA